VVEGVVADIKVVEVVVEGVAEDIEVVEVAEEEIVNIHTHQNRHLLERQIVHLIHHQINHRVIQQVLAVGLCQPQLDICSEPKNI